MLCCIFLPLSSGPVIGLVDGLNFTVLVLVPVIVTNKGIHHQHRVRVRVRTTALTSGGG